MSTPGLGKTAQLIGRIGKLSVPGLPWRVDVVVLDVRSRYGTVDVLIGSPDDDARTAEASGSDRSVWVEANRVDVRGPV